MDLNNTKNELYEAYRKEIEKNDYDYPFVNLRNTKAQILNAYKEALKMNNEKLSTVRQNEIQKQEENMNFKEINVKLNELKNNFNLALSELLEKKEKSITKYQEIENLISEKSNLIKEIFKIDDPDLEIIKSVSAKIIDNIEEKFKTTEEDYQQKIAEINLEIKNTQDSFTKTIKDMNKTFDLELERNEENYIYEIKRNRKKIENDFKILCQEKNQETLDKINDIRSETIEKLNCLNGELNELNMLQVEQENILSDYKILLTETDKRKEAGKSRGIEKANLIIENKLNNIKNEFAHKLHFYKGQKNLLITDIEKLEQKKSELKSELKETYDKIQGIALNKSEAASNEKFVENMKAMIKNSNLNVKAGV